MTAGLLSALEERYGEDRGIVPLWESPPGRGEFPRWEVARQTHLFNWGIGVDFQADPLPGAWACTECWWCLTVTIGPLSLWLRRAWSVKRPGVDA